MLSRFILIIIVFLHSLSNALALDISREFAIKDEPINPICIKNMLPLMSDRGIIVKSIVLDHCQNSNWAFTEEDVIVDGDSVTAKSDGENFTYKVLGKIKSDIFILHLTGNIIGAFKLENSKLRLNIASDIIEDLTILTYIGDVFVPCFVELKIEDNKVTIEKYKDDMNAGNSEACKTTTETIEIEINN
jgi:hypothetical protein